MFCNHCGAEIDDNSLICPRCGCSTKNYQNVEYNQSSINAGRVMGILSIIFSCLDGLLGIIFGIIGLNVSDNPKDRKLNVIGICLGIGMTAVAIIAFLILLAFLNSRLDATPTFN